MSARQENKQHDREHGRPIPDEAPVEEGPTPQPEHEEPRLPDPGPEDLSKRDWLAIVVRAGKETINDNMPMIASALAYSAFLAIPSVLLLGLGLFSLFAGPDTITTLIDKLGTVMPQQATQLIGDSLRRLTERGSAGLAMTIVGGAIAVWSVTSAMSTYMTGVTIAYDREDSRGFFKKRFTAVVMAAAIAFAFVLVAVFLIFGPAIEDWVGQALGIEGALKYVWWSAQWPILVAGLLAAFAVLLWLGPDVEHPRWRFVTLGSTLAVVVWIVASGAFAVYTAHFASYNKAWGSLASVIIMLTWLWLSSLAQPRAAAGTARRGRSPSAPTRLAASRNRRRAPAARRRPETRSRTSPI
jgi:membrane protein